MKNLFSFIVSGWNQLKGFSALPTNSPKRQPVRFSRAAILSVVRITAGRRHAWVNTAYGVIRKPIEAVPLAMR